MFNDVTEIEGFKCFSPDMALANDGFKSDFFSFLIQNEDKYFWFKERNKLILWAIQEFFPTVNNFLEIGCGTGFVSSAIANRYPEIDIYGSEIDIEGLKLANKRLKKEQLFQLDARNIPFAEAYDLIGIFDVLEHIDEDEIVLKQIYKALKPNGGLLITVPQHDFLWSNADDFSCHKRRYSRADLTTKIIKAGFNVKYMTSFVCTLLPFIMFSRLIRSKSDNYDPKSEFKLPAFINRLFRHLLQFERLLIRQKMSLPFGSSLVVVAFKD